MSLTPRLFTSGFSQLSRLIESGALGKKAWKKYQEGFLDEADVLGYFNTMKYSKYSDYNLDNWEKPDVNKRGVRDIGAQYNDEPNFRKKKRKISQIKVSHKCFHFNVCVF
jgi:hypothetical protein